MAKRMQISESIKGALRQNEIWWTLILEDDGTKFMEHEWSYVNEGVKKISLNEFLSADHPEALKAKVLTVLK